MSRTNRLDCRETLRGVNIDSLIISASEFASQLEPWEWVVAAAIVGLLLVGIIKQAAKIAVVAVVLMGLGIVLLNLPFQDWTLNF